MECAVTCTAQTQDEMPRGPGPLLMAACVPAGKVFMGNKQEIAENRIPELNNYMKVREKVCGACVRIHSGLLSPAEKLSEELLSAYAGG